MTVAAFILLGALAGIYGAMLGLGGGTLIVPALIILWHMDPHAAVPVSLCAVFASAASAASAYTRHGRMDFRSGFRFALAVVPGSLAGTILIEFIPAKALTALFGVLFTVIAILLALSPSGRGTGPVPARHHRRARLVRGMAAFFAAGLLSSLLGIGGGVMFMPIMILWLGFSNHHAVATSTLVIALSTLAGTASYALQGAIAWHIALPISLGAIVGAQTGAAIAKRLSAAWVGRLLALALAAIGIRMFLMSLSGR